MSNPVTTAKFILIAVEIGLNSEVKKLLTTFLTGAELLPRELPDVFARIQPKNPSNLIGFQIEYAPGQGYPINKESIRVDKLDLKEVEACYAVFAGPYLQHFKSYERTVKLSEDKNTGGTKVSITYKVEPKEGSPDIQRYIDFDLDVLKRIDNI